MAPNELHRFMSHVTFEALTGCWFWTGKVILGYGDLTFKGKNYKAHRVSYTHFKGEIPEGLYVLHSCDVKSCVNPDHLLVGTQLENVQDAARKGLIQEGHRKLKEYILQRRIS